MNMSNDQMMAALRALKRQGLTPAQCAELWAEPMPAQVQVTLSVTVTLDTRFDSVAEAVEWAGEHTIFEMLNSNAAIVGSIVVTDRKTGKVYHSDED